MLAIDVADVCGKSLAIAAAMSFSKFQGAMCPKGMSEVQLANNIEDHLTGG